jgi:ribonuclease E
MVKRMLIDASHAEETRVVVASGTRLEDFDFETAAKRQLKGNIYLAKVMRVEPSLQAAFVEYGGNRHGFLSFSEIHPDYYQIPVADREALFDEQQGDDDGEDDEVGETPPEGDVDVAAAAAIADPALVVAAEETEAADGEAPAAEDGEGAEAAEVSGDSDTPDEAEENDVEAAGEAPEGSATESVETLGGDEIDDEAERRLHVSRSLLSRRYKIQEVIKKRQIMLIQVVKEERGNKGAALTTYLSLAGRYCVLMPNAVRGGGISRKIVNAEDRKRLKAITNELEVPSRMAVIVRTAGLARTRAEIKRDFEYLLRQWEGIRKATLESSAPVLINEEANLIRRSIRDLYSRDIDQILVDGEDGYRIAKDFMRTLIPSHSSKVQPYRDRIPLFTRYQVEGQLDAMYSPKVQLRSGGYLIINPTEALVSIDVNSGRATKQRKVEETAVKTNLEAADEIARQLRLRDLAGLVVIDFIDMDENRNQRQVERRFKEAMRNDRARIQIGRISPFGLLELSRQRLRPSILEAATEPCSVCHGAGVVRATASSAVHVLRAIEEEGLRDRSARILVHVPNNIALYILNYKREVLGDIETRYHMQVAFEEDASLIPPMYTIETLQTRDGVLGEIESVAVAEEDERDAIAEEAEGEEQPRRRRRRRKPRGAAGSEARDGETAAEGEAESAAEENGGALAAGEDGEEDARGKRRRRGRRGGRRRGGRGRDGSLDEGAETAAETVGEDGEAAAEFDSSGEGEESGGGERKSRRPRRSRRRRKPDEAGESETPTAEMAEGADEEAAAPEGEDMPTATEGEVPEDAAAASDPSDDISGAANDAEPVSDEEQSAPEPTPEPAPEPASEPVDEALAAAAEADEAPGGENAAETEGAEGKEPAPRRTGWWQRVLS